MKFLVLVLLLASPSAYCALNLKPGLWSVSMNMKRDGVESDPMGQMNKMLAAMPPEQKKKMLEMMGKNGAGIGADGGTQICYSKEMLQNPESLAMREKKQCDVKFTTQTSTKVVMNFTCKDGSSGDANWDVLSQQSYKALVHLKSAKGVLSEIKSQGKFVAADCGTVKPILSGK